MTDWFQNDELFRRELEAGHRWAEAVADRLRMAGLVVQVTPMEWRETIEDRGRFANEGDITVTTGRGPVLVESKSRNLAFSGDPGSYPYETALIDTVSGWDQKEIKPTAVVLVSQRTKAMLVVPVASTRSLWTVKSTRDRVRDIEDRWYQVGKRHLVEFDDLASWLRRRNEHLE